MTPDTVATRVSTNWKTPLLRVAFITLVSVCSWQPLDTHAGALPATDPAPARLVDNTEASLNLYERKLIQEGLIWAYLSRLARTASNSASKARHKRVTIGNDDRFVAVEARPCQPGGVMCSDLFRRFLAHRQQGQAQLRRPQGF